jgi:hypothetical protein
MRRKQGRQRTRRERAENVRRTCLHAVQEGKGLLHPAVFYTGVDARVEMLHTEPFQRTELVQFLHFSEQLQCALPQALLLAHSQQRSVVALHCWGLCKGVQQ